MPLSSSSRLDREKSTMLLRVAGEREHYPGAVWKEVTFPSTGEGPEIQGWLLTPPSEGPWPTILYSHGGPTAVAIPSFHPVSQAGRRQRLCAALGQLPGVHVLRRRVSRGAHRQRRRGQRRRPRRRTPMARRVGHRRPGPRHPERLLVRWIPHAPSAWARTPSSGPAGIAEGAPVADWVVSGQATRTRCVDAYDIALFGTDKVAGGRDAEGQCVASHVRRSGVGVLRSSSPRRRHDTRTPVRPIRTLRRRHASRRQGGRGWTSSRAATPGVGKEHWVAIVESWLAFAERIIETRSARIGGA